MWEPKIRFGAQNSSLTAQSDQRYEQTDLFPATLVSLRSDDRLFQLPPAESKLYQPTLIPNNL